MAVLIVIVAMVLNAGDCKFENDGDDDGSVCEDGTSLGDFHDTLAPTRDVVLRKHIVQGLQTISSAERVGLDTHIKRDNHALFYRCFLLISHLDTCAMTFDDRRHYDD